MTQRTDVVVIGGGHAGLAAGYHLRRLGIEFVILDAQAAPGGAWQHTWDSLRLFSPAAYSSLPGRLTPVQPGEVYPDAQHVVSYLADYEKRYELPVQRGAQIAADLAGTADLTWVTQRPPRYLPDEIDGRALFDAATARRQALDAGRTDTGGVASLGDIVAVPPVRAARDAGLLTAAPMFSRLTEEGVAWADGTSAQADAIICCTGFRPDLAHFAPLRLRGTRGHIATTGTRAVDEPRLHLLGYGDWTDPASATLIGVGRPAREAAREICGTAPSLTRKSTSPQRHVVVTGRRGASARKELGRRRRHSEVRTNPERTPGAFPRRWGRGVAGRHGDQRVRPS